MDDRELLSDVGRGGAVGEAAVRALVARYLGLAYAVARRGGDPSAAEDVAQGVFVLMARKAGELRGREGGLGGWVFLTARHLARDAARAAERRRRHEREAAMRRGESTGAVSDELRAELDAAVEKLGGSEREAVVLRYYRGLSVDEAATALGASREAVRQRLSRAVRRLRAEMGGRVAVSSVAVTAAPESLAGKVAGAIGAKGAAGGGAVALAAKLIAGAVTVSVTGGAVWMGVAAAGRAGPAMSVRTATTTVAATAAVAPVSRTSTRSSARMVGVGVLGFVQRPGEYAVTRGQVMEPGQLVAATGPENMETAEVWVLRESEGRRWVLVPGMSLSDLLSRPQMSLFGGEWVYVFRPGSWAGVPSGAAGAADWRSTAPDVEPEARALFDRARTVLGAMRRGMVHANWGGWMGETTVWFDRDAGRLAVRGRRYDGTRWNEWWARADGRVMEEARSVVTREGGKPVALPDETRHWRMVLPSVDDAWRRALASAKLSGDQRLRWAVSPRFGEPWDSEWGGTLNSMRVEEAGAGLRRVRTRAGTGIGKGSESERVYEFGASDGCIRRVGYVRPEEPGQAAGFDWNVGYEVKEATEAEVEEAWGAMVPPGSGADEFELVDAEVGAAAPPFRAITASGDVFDLAASRGKVVLVQFFAGEGSEYLRWPRHSGRWLGRWGGGGLEVVRVVTDGKIADRVRSWPGRTVEAGEAGRVSREWGVEGGEHFVLVGRDGKVIWAGDLLTQELLVEFERGLERVMSMPSP